MSKQKNMTLENWDYKNFEVLERQGTVTELRCNTCWAYNLVNMRNKHPVETEMKCSDGEIRTFSLIIKCNHCDTTEHLEQNAPNSK